MSVTEEVSKRATEVRFEQLLNRPFIEVTPDVFPSITSNKSGWFPTRASHIVFS